MTDILCSLIFPVIPWIMCIIVVALSITVCALLLTVYEPVWRVDMMKDNENCVCDYRLHYDQGVECDPKMFTKFCKINNTVSEPCKLSSCALEQEVHPKVQYFHYINIFGLYWTLFFICGFGDMVLSGTFATWYWTFNKKKVPFFTITVSMYRTIRYKAYRV